MAMITAKLANMRWRNVQFFTVDPRSHSNEGEYSGGAVRIRSVVATVPTVISKKNYNKIRTQLKPIMPQRRTAATSPVKADYAPEANRSHESCESRDYPLPQDDHEVIAPLV